MGCDPEFIKKGSSELSWKAPDFIVGHKLNSVWEKADIKSTRMGTQNDDISSDDDLSNKEGLVI